jgi:hypothetical protein
MSKLYPGAKVTTVYLRRVIMPSEKGILGGASEGNGRQISSN